MFSTISNLAFPDDTAMFLLILAILSFALNAISFFFVRLLPPRKNDVHMKSGLSDSQVLHRSKSYDTQDLPQARGQPEIPTPRKSAEVSSSQGGYDGTSEEAGVDTRETSSLLSKSSDPGSEEYEFRRPFEDQSEEVDIRGLALLRKSKFWQLFFIFALLTGIGLMNIK
jgi:hypothetical protein